MPSLDYYATRKGPRYVLAHAAPQPSSLRAWISIASDVHGILAAEMVARGMYQALAERIVWRVVERHAAGAIRVGHVAAIRNGTRHSPVQAL